MNAYIIISGKSWNGERELNRRFSTGEDVASRVEVSAVRLRERAQAVVLAYETGLVKAGDPT